MSKPDLQTVRQKRKKEFVATVNLGFLGCAAVLGFLLHRWGRVALLGIVLFPAVALYGRIRKRDELTRGWVLATIASFVFLISSMLGDSVMPATAVCSDGSYSYSDHHQGTCSWHGGVSQWNPPSWWK